MSIDFDTGALQTQQNDNEEYDPEDYAREQLLQQLLTGLPHDMLDDDSLCSASEPNYSDCSDHELSEHNEPWHPETQWGDNGKTSDRQNQYPGKAVAPQYMEQQMGPLRSEAGGDEMRNGWAAQHGDDEEIFTDKYNNYRKPITEESNVGSFHSDDHYDGPDHSTGDLYHLPADFQPYTNGGYQITENFAEASHKQNQMYTAPQGNGDHPEDSIPVRYNPYQINGAHKDVIPDAARRLDNYEDLQKEFLDTGECTSGNMQFIQLQVLYKAKGRQLEEFGAKLDESERQLRYLNHQLVIVKDEKEGLAISLQESQTLLQNSREMELQLRGQMAALQNNVDGLTSNDEQLRKELKVAKLAMESMQQQVMDLRRSDSINRAREQHEMVVSTLKRKHEEQILMLQQRLDEINAAFQEQKECCSRLEEQLKRSERKGEESKLEKTEMINRLSRSLEESQKQCANLLHTGSIQEASQLRMQLQQLQSSKTISDGMNKALQEEINELKEQITMYESAAKLGVFLGAEEQEEFSDSYRDLGIKKVNWQKSRFQRSLRTNGVRKDLPSDAVITELKTELERCMSSNKAKRQQIMQLQSDLKGYQSKTEELKKLLERAEKEVKDCEVRPGNFDCMDPHRSTEQESQEIQRLLDENRKLQQEVEKHLLHIDELTANEEKLKAANQQLCSEMREMIQDFDIDKKESIERCERTYEQHHEDIKNHLRMELSEKLEAEKVQLSQSYEMNISQLQSQMNELSNEMTAVQECYIAMCKEKDTLEDTIRENLRKEFQLNEEKWRDQLLEEKEHLLQSLKRELEDKHQSELAVMKAQGQREKEEEIKRQTEIHLALAKEDWIKEQQQATAIKIQDIENQWKHKLDNALKHARETLMQRLEDCAVQTEQSLIVQSVLETEQLEDLKMKLGNAMLEKEKAVQKACMELEIKHWEDISTQISDAVAAAEDKWKLESEKSQHKECEEKIAALQRESDMKAEEFEAQMKVEVGKARAQWSKEKQEEVQAVQAQNEKDFRTFLDDHRTKISDVLHTAKADFEKQRNELLAQKEAAMTEQFNKSLKLRISEESKRLYDHDNEILSEIENLMSEIHDELVEKCKRNERLSHATGSLEAQFLQKLRSYLQRSVKGIVYKIVSNAKQGMKPKADENETSRDSSVLRGKERLHPEGAQKNPKRILTENLANGHLQTMLTVDPPLKKKSESSEFGCCENCQKPLEKSKKECQELRNKLDKACRHLQQAVKEQKLRMEQFKENETIVQTLKIENLDLQKKLDEKSVNPKESSSPEEGSEKGCDMCKGKALEEMRSQYIKAVDKIKSDMLRYIHESKGRAAEMLKSEVLKERQETARKMRKYYLTCLQQLLKDDGKNEGAEKKIMNAASKLATMAKVLETPISHKTQSRNFRVAPVQIGNKTEHEMAKSVNAQICVTDRLKTPITEQRTIDELIRRHMKEKLDGSIFPTVDTSASKQDEISRQLRKDCTIAPPVCTLPLEEGRTLNCTGSDAESNQRPFHGRSEPSFLQGLKSFDCQDHLKAKGSRRRFELQETPVRDNGDNGWGLVSGKGLFPSQSPLTSMKVPSYNLDAGGKLSAAGLFSHAEESRDAFGSRYEGQNHSAHIAKRRDQTPSTWHSSKITGHPPTSVESGPYSDVGRDNQLPQRTLLKDFATPPQDSGFDSPFPDVNSFK
ncbi:centrosomal protein of 152 kDa isoform X2 [Rana temporaria]|uniref:centrosomal protein of 152 kDa isoform X2 n=1 Tax=Rana temporaria TaxID=8407 RepID=UPI001AAD623A|nr:centrosomal protein of 152 kDa isoform X2 [Rana temporaria]